MEGTCQYVLKSSCGQLTKVVLQLVGWACFKNAPKDYHVVNIYKGHRLGHFLWHGRQWESDMRFDMWSMRNLHRSGSLLTGQGISKWVYRSLGGRRETLDGQKIITFLYGKRNKIIS
jgi:hypothetical protein